MGRGALQGSKLRPPHSPCTRFSPGRLRFAPRDYRSSCSARRGSSGRRSRASEQKPPALLSREQLPGLSASRDFTQYGTCLWAGVAEGRRTGGAILARREQQLVTRGRNSRELLFLRARRRTQARGGQAANICRVRPTVVGGANA